MYFSGQRVVELLSALEAEGRTALEIVEVVRRATRGRVRIPRGTIYTQLARLEAVGLVRGRYQTGARGERPRRLFKLTASGRRVLRNIDAIRCLAVRYSGTRRRFQEIKGND